MAGYLLHVHCYGRIRIARALLWQNKNCTCIVMAGCVARTLLWLDTCCTCIVMAGCVARALLWQDTCRSALL